MGGNAEVLEQWADFLSPDGWPKGLTKMDLILREEDAQTLARVLRRTAAGTLDAKALDQPPLRVEWLEHHDKEAQEQLKEANETIQELRDELAWYEKNN